MLNRMLIYPFLNSCIFLLIVSLSVFAQKHPTVQVCRSATFAVFKRLPKLQYECPEDPNDSDEKILKLPARMAAIRELERALQLFTGTAWWSANVDDLSACEIHGRVGKLTDEEKDKVKDGDFAFQLFGNHQMRLVLLADSCYLTGYAGSNAFLLYRKEGKLFVTQVLNGYASRVANSVLQDCNVS